MHALELLEWVASVFQVHFVLVVQLVHPLGVAVVLEQLGLMRQHVLVLIRPMLVREIIYCNVLINYLPSGVLMH